MLARYTERCIEVRFCQFGKLEFTAPTLLFRLIALFNSIIWLSYMQEQSRQTLLPGLKLSYDHPHFARCFLRFHTEIHAVRPAVQAAQVIQPLVAQVIELGGGKG